MRNRGFVDALSDFHEVVNILKKFGELPNGEDHRGTKSF